MAQFRNIFPVDLQTGYKDPVPLMQPVGEGDAKGVRVGARVTSNGADVDLGGQCVGYVRRPDGSTVPLTGTISGNQAYVTLDQTCCAIEGPIQVAVAWVSGTNITTLLVAYGTVVNTITGNTVQPSTPIPDLTQLLAEIDAMRQATADAEAAASKSVRYDTTQDLTAAQQLTARNNISAARAGIIDIFAVAFSENTHYVPGAYATYNGSLYRFVADHPAGAWDSSHVVAVTVGNEINNTTVKANMAQDLSGANKAQARANIDAAAIGIIAVAFNASTSYSAGEYCTYNGSLYRFTSDHTGAWNSAHVVAVTVGNEINTTTVKVNLSQNLTGDQKGRARNNIDAAAIGTLAVAFDASTTYHPGEYCTRNGSLYRFTAEHTGAWSDSDAIAVTVANEINNTTVKTNVSQSLSDDQKTRARSNIGAASAADLTAEVAARAAADNDLNSAVTTNDESTMQILALQDVTQISAWFQQGSISSTGAETASTIRIRSNYINLNGLKSIVVTPASGYKVAIELYNDQKAYKKELGFGTIARTVTVGTGTNDAYYVRLLLAHTNDSAITPSDGGNVSVTANTILKNAFDKLADINAADFTDLSNADVWGYGAVHTNGNVNPVTTRIHSAFRAINKGDLIFAQWDSSSRIGIVRFEVVMFDHNMQHIQSSGWMAWPYEVPINCIAAINVKKADDSAITQEEMSSYIENVFYTKGPVNNQKWEYDEGVTIKSINHRGWVDAPENTLPAYVESFRHGFRYIETDIRFTSDGVPVCLHDATLNRTCRNADGTELSSTVAISDITYAESQTYDAGIAKGVAYEGTKIPKLTEVLDLCKALNLLPYLDIGVTPHPTKANITAIIDAVVDCGMVGRVTFLSDFDVLIWITHMLPNARVAPTSSLNISYVRYTKALLTGYNQVFMDVQYSNITSDGIASCKAIGIPIEIWTVNDTSIIDSMAPYITGVTSDSIVASTYLANKNAPTTYTAPTVAYDRAENVSGGYCVSGNKVSISLKFTSKYSANNTPTMFTGVPVPLAAMAALTAVELVNADTIGDSISAFISGTVLYVSKVETGKTYILTGEYPIQLTF